MDSQRELVKRMTRITTKLVPDGKGVGLRFINVPTSWGNQLNEAGVEKAMAGVRPRGGTKIGTMLKQKILQPLIYDRLDRGSCLSGRCSF